MDGLLWSDPQESGLDRGIAVVFTEPEGSIQVSFDTPGQMLGDGCISVRFKYRIPEKPWKKDVTQQNLEVIFHLPIGLPLNWMHRFEIIKGRSSTRDRTSSPSLLNRLLWKPIEVFKEYYSIPWGYSIDYESATLHGKLHGLFYAERRLVYAQGNTRWLGAGQTELHFTVRPNLEAPFVGIAAGLVLTHFTPLPVWSIVVVLILIFPLFSRGSFWKVVELLR